MPHRHPHHCPHRGPAPPPAAVELPSPPHPLTSSPSASGEPSPVLWALGDAKSSVSQPGSAWGSAPFEGPSARPALPGPCRLPGPSPTGAQASSAVAGGSVGAGSIGAAMTGQPGRAAGSAGSRPGSVTQSGEQGTVASCSASPSSSSAEPSAPRWATGPPGHGAPSAARLLAMAGPGPSDPLFPREHEGRGAGSPPSKSPSMDSPKSGVSRMGEQGGDTSRCAPCPGNVHSKDWDRLQPPRDSSGGGSPGRGRVLSEPPSSSRPCPTGRGCNSPSEHRRSPESLEGGGGLESGPLGDWGDAEESSGPSGEPGGQETLTGGSGAGLGGAQRSAADSGEPGGQVTLGGSSGVVGGLPVSGDPSPGVWGEPGEREAPGRGSAVEQGAPGAWLGVAGTSAGG